MNPNRLVKSFIILEYSQKRNKSRNRQRATNFPRETIGNRWSFSNDVQCHLFITICEDNKDIHKMDLQTK